MTTIFAIFKDNKIYKN